MTTLDEHDKCECGAMGMGTGWYLAYEICHYARDQGVRVLHENNIYAGTSLKWLIFSIEGSVS